jgi:hypothetical protein
MPAIAYSAALRAIGKSDASFFQRQIIRRVRKADESNDPARLHFFDEMFRAQNHRRCAVGDLLPIADFERRRDGQVDLARGAGLIKCELVVAHLGERVQPRVCAIFMAGVFARINRRRRRSRSREAGSISPAIATSRRLQNEHRVGSSR